MNILSTLWNLALYQPLHNLITYLYVLTGSIGFSTFILILFIRGILLSPLISKQQKDAKKMKAIQPRLNELKEKYKDDPKKMSEAQQKIYKEINYNPLGCLMNFVIQIPIYIAIYQSVRSFTNATPETMTGLYPQIQQMLLATGEKVFATKLWGIDLFTSPSVIFQNGFAGIADSIPYIVLMILFALANVLPTYVSKKVMNTQAPPKAKRSGAPKEEGEEMQEMLTQSINQSTTYMMPIMMTVMMFPLQSIIHVYMIINGVISTTQQILIKKRHDKKLKEDLQNVLSKEYDISKSDIDSNVEALMSLPASISFLADELAEFKEFKTLSVKVDEIPFSKVLKRNKGNPVSALIMFGEMAKDPDKARDVYSKR